MLALSAQPEADEAGAEDIEGWVSEQLEASVRLDAFLLHELFDSVHRYRFDFFFNLFG